LLEIAPKIDLEKINRVIKETPAISHTRKLFYKTMVRVRKELIIDKAYEMIKNEKNDIEAYNRIVNGVAVAETDMLNIIEKVKKDGWEYSKLFDNVNKEERKILEDNHIIYNNHSEKAIESNDEYER
jgi:hypothetical protein